MPEPSDTLLVRLGQGDARAAEEVFRRYETYLRKMVRRQLPDEMRAKFDSIDVVQSVWLDVLRGLRRADWQFATAAQLKAFLVKVTRNRFIDTCRQHRRAAECEQTLPQGSEAGEPPSPAPRPSQVAHASDLWEQMLALCPPEHRELLRLKREGLSAPEIAARTGLHEDSVRRVLRELARQMALTRIPRPGG
jgi:RNA polymerase sigma-70 factor (ECF subfamily)